MSQHRFFAILLLGPTGSGKTPLGDLLEARGWCGDRCVHFDFGANLRAIVETGVSAHDPVDAASRRVCGVQTAFGNFCKKRRDAASTTLPPERFQTGSLHPKPLSKGEGTTRKDFSSEDIALLRDVLDAGKLLEDEHFPLAERILRSFLTQRSVEGQTWVVLNGLPRHVGQAEAIDAILDVQGVICLECSSETVLKRLRTNVGGDRCNRGDDDPSRVRQKLATYHGRTTPLVDHYRKKGVPIQTIGIEPTTTPEETWEMLNQP